MMNNAKRFDCLKMKYDIQTQINAETTGMSTSELLRYFNTGCSDKRTIQKGETKKGHVSTSIPLQGKA